ncbi:hypothetical protein ACJX0J_025659 [Zea mays]
MAFEMRRDIHLCTDEQEGACEEEEARARLWFLQKKIYKILQADKDVNQARIIYKNPESNRKGYLVYDWFMLVHQHNCVENAHGIEDVTNNMLELNVFLHSLIVYEFVGVLEKNKKKNLRKNNSAEYSLDEQIRSVSQHVTRMLLFNMYLVSINVLISSN